MTSASLLKFNSTILGAKVLQSYVGVNSSIASDQVFVDKTCMMAAIAAAVGCWEGYIESALREFVSKTRFQAHRRAWGLIVQFETVVDKMTSDLNTPNWERTRDLMITVTGMDPYVSWVWLPKYTSQVDTKLFFDGVMRVRHSFAHGFAIPSNVPGLVSPGILDLGYVNDAIKCIEFFATATDSLLEHELIYRHSCQTGWN
jgi:hypothetical protein